MHGIAPPHNPHGKSSGKTAFKWLFRLMNRHLFNWWPLRSRGRKPMLAGWTVLAAMLATLLTTQATAQSGGHNCYTATAGTIGDGGPCQGMLIVDKRMLHRALTSGADKYILHDGTRYTFGDSRYNVFTGQVTDIWGMFYRDRAFNADIGYWDVSKVTDMTSVFGDANAFNQDISRWDVSKVTDMQSMFYGAHAFNQDISNWDVSNVRNMRSMFYDANAFNQDISNWDVAHITTEPAYFSSDSPLEERHKPQWGPPRPASIAFTPAPPTTVAAGEAITPAPVVQVMDRLGNPVAGVSVSFTVTAGGGTLDSEGAVTTDALGQATAPTWTSGTVAGDNTLTASTAGYGGSTVTQALTVTTVSGASAFEAARDDVQALIVAEAGRTLNNQMSSVRGMMNAGRTRFVETRRQLDECRSEGQHSAACEAGAASRSVPFDVDGSFRASPKEITTQGTFFGQTGTATGQRLVFGDFNITHEDGETSALLSIRHAWEWMAGEQTMQGLFLGGDLSRSPVDSRGFSGTIEGYGLSFGGYLVSELRTGLYFDAHAALGWRHVDVNIANDVLDLDGGYDGYHILSGMNLTGVFKGTGYEIWPRLGLEYGRSDIGDVTFDATAYGLTDSVSLAAGAVERASLIFTPEFRIPLDWSSGTNASLLTLGPRIQCDYTKDALSQSRACGGGLDIGLSHGFADGRGQADVKISADRVGDTTRTSVTLGAELQF